MSHSCQRDIKAAALGFGITVVPLVIVATVHLILMPQIVAAMEGLDGNERASAIWSLRRDWFATHSIVVIMLAIYWVTAAAYGGDKILQIRIANRLLAFCVIVYLTICFYYIFASPPDGLSIFCSLFGIPNTDAPAFGFDVPSTCEAFIYAANQMIVLVLMGLIVPLFISLIVRIISSRRENQPQDDAPPLLDG